MSAPSFGVLLTLVALASAAARQQQRVANGTKVEPGDVPYIAQILVNDEHVCGGFIYKDMWVVTAAACVEGKRPSEVRVAVGQVSLIEPDPEEQMKSVFEIKTFPTYNGEIKLHDIALLNLASRITFNDSTGFVRPIAYAPVDETLDNPGIFYGWGSLIDGGLNSLHLRTTSVTFVGSLPCRNYGSDQYFELYMICAGDSAVDPGAPCIYDEGSPLVQKSPDGELNVVGIMSKNNGCSPGSWPTIYTRMSAYQAWIDSVVNVVPT